MNHAWLMVFAYWAFSAVIGGMPDPNPTSTPAYKWAYSSLHILAGNIPTAVSARYQTLTGIPQPFPAGSAIEHKETQITTVVTSEQ